jgi:hypothetical protein
LTSCRIYAHDVSPVMSWWKLCGEEYSDA